jgi:flagellar protein FliO/FliZ|tara:strand:+ start:1842 stop:2243 length:402 start_codon:yes stop_codon:yes gene_type:complete
MAVTENTVLQSPSISAGESVPVTSVSSVGLSLFLVIALIAALAWMARRLRPAGDRSGDLKIRSTLHLGARERVVMIDAAGTHVLVSVAGGQIRHLHTYDSAPVMQEDKPPAADSMQSDFRQRMRDALGLEREK